MGNHILLVHDGESLWDRLAADLIDQGFQVANFPYKKVVLSAIQIVAPDLIILDFKAPHGGAGWIFLQLLRMEMGLRSIPILVTTTGMSVYDDIKDYLASQNIPVVYQVCGVESLIVSIQRLFLEGEQAASKTTSAAHGELAPAALSDPQHKNAALLYGADARYSDTFQLHLPDRRGETQTGRLCGNAFIETMQPVVLEVDGQQLTLPSQEGLVLGRWSGNSDSAQPDIDLREFDALPMGVSRRHVLISRQNALVYVTDLAARNGTWLNGQRLESHNKRLLRDGDELRLARLQMRVLFKQGQISAETARDRNG